MNRHLQILGLISLLIVTSCSTSSKIIKVNEPREVFRYPIVVQTTASFEHTWSKLVDLIAIKGYPIAHLDKENGLFISGILTDVPYAIESSNRKSDSTSVLVLPRLRLQQSGIGKSKPLRLVYPDSIYVVLNVRVRPNGAGGTFVNVNIPDIVVRGGHYNQRQLKLGDTTTIAAATSVNRKDWGSTKSTGNLENFIINAIRTGDIESYQK